MNTKQTSTILAIAKQLFGPELFKDRVLELNASDERGINVIRTKVKSFAQISVGSGKPNKSYKYPCPPFKLIILDEADSMTSDAQAALRRTMETYSNVTRFCLICNYVTKIIEPLTSRCAKFRFKSLDSDLIMDRLQFIAQKEGLKVSDACLTKVIQVSEGDLRRAITTLQSASRIFGDNVRVQDITEISGIVPDESVSQYLNCSLSNDFSRLQKYVTHLTHEGYSAQQVLSQLSDILITNDKISGVNKGIICLEIADAEKRLVDGADEYLQLLQVGSLIMKVSGGSASGKRDDPMEIE